MKKDKIYVPEQPELHCSKCKRVVYQTIHSAREYWVDWYKNELTKRKVVCVDCFKETYSSPYSINS
jgi:hypothetical protein